MDGFLADLSDWKIDPERSLGYWRVSTRVQELTGHSKERYEEQLLSAGVKKENILHDTDSGGKMTRSGLTELMSRLKRSDKFHTVVVPFGSRLHRSVAHAEETYKFFEENNIYYVELDEGKMPIDLSSADGRLKAQVKAIFAEYERNKNTETAKRGHALRRRKKHSQKALFGYQLDNGKPTPDKQYYRDTTLTRWGVALEVLETIVQEQGFDQALQVLVPKYGQKRWNGQHNSDFPRSSSGLRRWATNPTLQGYVVQNTSKERLKKFGIEVQKAEDGGTLHTPLIKPSQLEYIQGLVDRNKKGFRSKKQWIRNPFVGLAFCAKCGSKMRQIRSGTRDSSIRYVRCSAAVPHQNEGKPKKCDQSPSYGLTVNKLREQTREKIKLKAKEIAEWSRTKDTEDNHRESPPEVIRLQSLISQLESHNEPGLLNFIEEKKAELNRLIRPTEDASDEDTKKLIQSLIPSIESDDYWKDASVEKEQLIYAALIKRIDINKGVCKYHWKV